MAAAQKMSQPRDYKLIVEKDVKIPLRDGTILYGDIFRALPAKQPDAALLGACP